MTQIEFDTDLISVRTFKTYLYSLRQYEDWEPISDADIENIAKYMDKYESGMFYLDDMVCAI